MMPIGTIAPHFTLLDTVSGTYQSLSDLKSNSVTVVMFICNHCPFVVYIQDKLIEVAQKYKAQGVSFIAISANNIETHPQDGPKYMTNHAREAGFCFPYLYDETQAVAKAYDAACTPDFYVFNAELKCVYRGQFDASRPGNDQSITGKDLSRAIELAQKGEMIPEKEQRPSQGCNIKWKVELSTIKSV